MIKLLVPRLMLPDVAVKFNAPVVWVRPLAAVSSPFAVIVPVPVVEIDPDVDSVPSSLIVKVSALLDLMAREVLVAPRLESLMIKATPVPALVRDWEVASPLPRVKSIFLPTVVAMVLPALYAACNEMEPLSQLTRLLELFRHRIVPDPCCNPFSTTLASAVNVFPTPRFPETVASPENVDRPVPRNA